MFAAVLSAGGNVGASSPRHGDRHRVTTDAGTRWSARAVASHRRLARASMLERARTRDDPDQVTSDFRGPPKVDPVSHKFGTGSHRRVHVSEAVSGHQHIVSGQNRQLGG
jgi:hypothetical protein